MITNIRDVSYEEGEIAEAHHQMSEKIIETKPNNTATEPEKISKVASHNVLVKQNFSQERESTEKASLLVNRKLSTPRGNPSNVPSVPVPSVQLNSSIPFKNSRPPIKERFENSTRDWDNRSVHSNQRDVDWHPSLNRERERDLNDWPPLQRENSWEGANMGSLSNGLPLYRGSGVDRDRMSYHEPMHYSDNNIHNDFIDYNSDMYNSSNYYRQNSINRYQPPVQLSRSVSNGYLSDGGWLNDYSYNDYPAPFEMHGTSSRLDPSDYYGQNRNLMRHEFNNNSFSKKANDRLYPLQRQNMNNNNVQINGKEEIIKINDNTASNSYKSTVPNYNLNNKANVQNFHKNKKFNNAINAKPAMNIKLDKLNNKQNNIVVEPTVASTGNNNNANDDAAVSFLQSNNTLFKNTDKVPTQQQNPVFTKHPNPPLPMQPKPPMKPPPPLSSKPMQIYKDINSNYNLNNKLYDAPIQSSNIVKVPQPPLPQLKRFYSDNDVSYLPNQNTKQINATQNSELNVAVSPMKVIPKKNISTVVMDDVEPAKVMSPVKIIESRNSLHEKINLIKSSNKSKDEPSKVATSSAVAKKTLDESNQSKYISSSLSKQFKPTPTSIFDTLTKYNSSSTSTLTNTIFPLKHQTLQSTNNNSVNDTELYTSVSSIDKLNRGISNSSFFDEKSSNIGNSDSSKFIPLRQLSSDNSGIVAAVSDPLTSAPRPRAKWGQGIMARANAENNISTKTKIETEKNANFIVLKNAILTPAVTIKDTEPIPGKEADLVNVNIVEAKHFLSNINREEDIKNDNKIIDSDNTVEKKIENVTSNADGLLEKKRNAVLLKQESGGRGRGRGTGRLISNANRINKIKAEKRMSSNKFEKEKDTNEKININSQIINSSYSNDGSESNHTPIQNPSKRIKVESTDGSSDNDKDKQTIETSLTKTNIDNSDDKLIPSIESLQLAEKIKLESEQLKKEEIIQQEILNNDNNRNNSKNRIRNNSTKQRKRGRPFTSKKNVNISVEATLNDDDDEDVEANSIADYNNNNNNGSSAESETETIQKRKIPKETASSDVKSNHYNEESSPNKVQLNDTKRGGRGSRGGGRGRGGRTTSRQNNGSQVNRKPPANDVFNKSILSKPININPNAIYQKFCSGVNVKEIFTKKNDTENAIKAITLVFKSLYSAHVPSKVMCDLSTFVNATQETISSILPMPATHDINLVIDMIDVNVDSYYSSLQLILQKQYMDEVYLNKHDRKTVECDISEDDAYATFYQQKKYDNNTSSNINNKKYNHLENPIVKSIAHSNHLLIVTANMFCSMFDHSFLDIEVKNDFDSTEKNDNNNNNNNEASNNSVVEIVNNSAEKKVDLNEKKVDNSTTAIEGKSNIKDADILEKAKEMSLNENRKNISNEQADYNQLKKLFISTTSLTGASRYSDSLVSSNNKHAMKSNLSMSRSSSFSEPASSIQSFVSNSNFSPTFTKNSKFSVNNNNNNNNHEIGFEKEADNNNSTGAADNNKNINNSNNASNTYTNSNILKNNETAITKYPINQLKSVATVYPSLPPPNSTLNLKKNSNRVVDSAIPEKTSEVKKSVTREKIENSNDSNETSRIKKKTTDHNNKDKSKNQYTMSVIKTVDKFIQNPKSFYSQPEESIYFQENIKSMKKIRPTVMNVIRNKKLATVRSLEILADKYLEVQHKWNAHIEEVERIENENILKEGPKLRGSASNLRANSSNLFELPMRSSKPSLYSSNQGSNMMAMNSNLKVGRNDTIQMSNNQNFATNFGLNVARSDYEQERLLQQVLAQELRQTKMINGLCEIPKMSRIFPYADSLKPPTIPEWPTDIREFKVNDVLSEKKHIGEKRKSNSKNNYLNSTFDEEIIKSSGKEKKNVFAAVKPLITPFYQNKSDTTFSIDVSIEEKADSSLFMEEELKLSAALNDDDCVEKKVENFDISANGKVSYDNKENFSIDKTFTPKDIFIIPSALSEPVQSNNPSHLFPTFYCSPINFIDIVGNRLTLDGKQQNCSSLELNKPCEIDCNCALQVDRISRLERIWSDVEKCIFVDKFLQYPKNFSKIASFLKNRTTKDCVKFYYDAKSTIEFKHLLKEFENRRKQFKSSWSYTVKAAHMLCSTIYPPVDNENKLPLMELPVDDTTYSSLTNHPENTSRLVNVPVPKIFHPITLFEDEGKNFQITQPFPKEKTIKLAARRQLLTSANSINSTSKINNRKGNTKASSYKNSSVLTSNIYESESSDIGETLGKIDGNNNQLIMKSRKDLKEKIKILKLAKYPLGNNFMYSYNRKRLWSELNSSLFYSTATSSSRIYYSEHLLPFKFTHLRNCALNNSINNNSNNNISNDRMKNNIKHTNYAENDVKIKSAVRVYRIGQRGRGGVRNRVSGRGRGRTGRNAIKTSDVSAIDLEVNRDKEVAAVYAYDKSNAAKNSNSSTVLISNEQESRLVEATLTQNMMAASNENVEDSKAIDERIISLIEVSENVSYDENVMRNENVAYDQNFAYNKNVAFNEHVESKCDIEEESEAENDVENFYNDIINITNNDDDDAEKKSNDDMENEANNNVDFADCDSIINQSEKSMNESVNNDNNNAIYNIIEVEEEEDDNDDDDEYNNNYEDENIVNNNEDDEMSIQNDDDNIFATVVDSTESIVVHDVNTDVYKINNENNENTEDA